MIYSTVQAVQSMPPHITVEELPKAVRSTFLTATPGTLKELPTSDINLNSVDYKLVKALMPFQIEGVRSVLFGLCCSYNKCRVAFLVKIMTRS